MEIYLLMDDENKVDEELGAFTSFEAVSWVMNYLGDVHRIMEVELHDFDKHEAKSFALKMNGGKRAY